MFNNKKQRCEENFRKRQSSDRKLDFLQTCLENDEKVKK